MDVCGFNVVRVYMGAMMTSLEMGGVSLTLLSKADTWTDSLGGCNIQDTTHSVHGIVIDMPTTAPGWPSPSLGTDGSVNRVDSTPFSCPKGGEEQTGTGTTTPTTAVGKYIPGQFSYLLSTREGEQMLSPGSQYFA